MTSGEWTWDPTPYAGSARSYPLGPVPCPAEPAAVLTAALPADGPGRLLDVGRRPVR